VRYKAGGPEGLVERRIGRASARAVPVEEVMRRLERTTGVLQSSIFTGSSRPSMAVCAPTRGLRTSCRRPGRWRVPPTWDAPCNAPAQDTARRCLGGCDTRMAPTHEWVEGYQWNLEPDCDHIQPAASHPASAAVDKAGLQEPGFNLRWPSCRH
jgi:hypothetical protein